MPAKMAKTTAVSSAAWCFPQPTHHNHNREPTNEINQPPTNQQQRTKEKAPPARPSNDDTACSATSSQPMTSMNFDGVHTRETSMQFAIPPSPPDDENENASKIFNDALGNLTVTGWQLTGNVLKPPGLGLKTDGIDASEAETLYMATLQDDCAAVDRAHHNTTCRHARSKCPSARDLKLQ